MIFANFYKYIKKFFKKENCMAKKLKKYKVTPNESLCLAVSVVDKPAVESEFVYLSEQKQENFVAVEKKERRMIYGCALRADFPIYRNNGSEEYYIEFDAEAIDKISKDFLKNGFQKNWTVGHEAEVENLSVCESWIKESPTMDKSIAIGLDADIPVGSWFLGCYCENDDVWEAVKSGKYHGFSCEALVGLEEFEKQINENLSSEEELKEELNEQKTDIVEEELEEAEKPVETPPVEPKVEEPTTVQEEPKQEPVEPANEPAEKPVEEQPKNDGHLEELINNLKAEIEALKDVNKGLSNKVKELGKTPSAKPVNTNAKTGNPADTYSAWREKMRQMI